MKNGRTLEDELFYMGLAAIPAAALFGLCYHVAGYFLPQNFCVFSVLFGIYCPGCGGTRALRALLQGRFLLSVWYHPLVPYMAVMYLGFMGSHAFRRLGWERIRGWKFHNWYLWAGVALISVNFIVKNVLRLGFGILM
ncbi:MAG: DUF2752 domain-containing protein [Roseburia sp.]|nr:DUF2752 domain-containing protein [Roseburia sp.]MCM1097331.1 DUF2752 domain-containing protein [Ruminococcus flavefaciens]